ncbi:hypothetical protein EB820_02955 [Brevibacillus agri]|uniref:Uncharacterized protein n=1 Tax=Brevibacillus agri TaxID=51101 RepID=A0A3M8BAY4_9BACL|nr:hypothetical protein D478_17961 [Brevibacillus agri BAB-2500]QAV11413.1 hypothetical protein BA6348_00535 [Brevibacillus agri]RNB60500.1 hypothetical protein EB820_02955 [Brevibacillus agri]
MPFPVLLHAQKEHLLKIVTMIQLQARVAPIVMEELGHIKAINQVATIPIIAFPDLAQVLVIGIHGNFQSFLQEELHWRFT